MLLGEIDIAPLVLEFEVPTFLFFILLKLLQLILLLLEVLHFLFYSLSFLGTKTRLSLPILPNGVILPSSVTMTVQDSLIRFQLSSVLQ